MVWSSVNGHLQQEASGTLRIFHIEKSDTFSKDQSRAGGNAAHCIYIFSLSLCLLLALKSSDAILFLSELLSEAILVPHSCRYLFSYCSFPLCQIHFDSQPSQAAVLDSTCWMRVLFQTGKICNPNRATGWLEQQRKSSQKQVVTYFFCDGYQNSDLSEWKTDLLS